MLPDTSDILLPDAFIIVLPDAMLYVCYLQVSQIWSKTEQQMAQL